MVVRDWRHRKLQGQTLVCHVMHTEVMFEPDLYGDIAMGDFHSCEPVDSEGYISPQSYTLELDQQLLSEATFRLNAGLDLFIEITDVDLSSDSVLLTSSSQMKIVDAPRNLRHVHRRLDRVTGTKQVAVLRIVANDAEPTLFASSFRELLFQGEDSMSSQVYQCSNGQLNLQPSVVGVANVRVDLSTATSTHGALVNAAVSAVNLPNGVQNIRDVADFIMLIVPPGSGNFAAYAVVNGAQSVYSDMWGAYLGAQLHELGHNWGLRHAWKDGLEYNGQSGSMGGAPSTLRSPRRCFNGQNNWLLGWFGDAQMEVNPTNPGIYKVIAFVDFRKRLEGHAILKVGQHYLQYNRAKDYNEETTDGADKLTVVKDNGRDGTDLVALLDGSTPAFLIPGTRITIDVCDSVIGGSNVPDYLLVSIGNSGSLCRPPTRSPTRRPTSRPTRRPTPSPSQRPALPPTPRPTLAPTSRITGSPTAVPSHDPSSIPSLDPTVFPVDSPTRTPWAGSETLAPSIQNGRQEGLGRPARPVDGSVTLSPTLLGQAGSSLRESSRSGPSSSKAAVVTILMLLLCFTVVAWWFVRRRRKRRARYYDTDILATCRATTSDKPMTSELLNATSVTDDSSSDLDVDPADVCGEFREDAGVSNVFGTLIASLGLRLPSIFQANVPYSSLSSPPISNEVDATSADTPHQEAIMRSPSPNRRGLPQASADVYGTKSSPVATTHEAASAGELSTQAHAPHSFARELPSAEHSQEHGRPFDIQQNESSLIVIEKGKETLSGRGVHTSEQNVASYRPRDPREDRLSTDYETYSSGSFVRNEKKGFPFSRSSEKLTFHSETLFDDDHSRQRQMSPDHKVERSRPPKPKGYPFPPHNHDNDEVSAIFANTEVPFGRSGRALDLNQDSRFDEFNPHRFV